MIKSIITGLIVLGCALPLKAQDTKHQFKIEFEDFNSSDLSNSEQMILNILIRREIKQLKKDIENLQDDYKNGRISKTEFEYQKTKKSEDVAYKISKSVEIISDQELSDSTEVSGSLKITENKKKTIWEVMKEEKGPKSYYLEMNSNSDTLSTYYPKDYQGVNFGFGFANWLDEDFNRYNNPNGKLKNSSSLYFQITFKNFHYLNPKNKQVSIDYGISLMSKYYEFNNPNYSINAEDNGISSIDKVNITESQLIQSSLEIPLEFTFRSKKSLNKGFVLTTGVYGGWNFRTKQKIKYSVNNSDFTSKIISDFDTQNFYAGGKIKIGYRKVFLEGKYNFTEQFNNDNSINVNPYTIGLTFGL